MTEKYQGQDLVQKEINAIYELEELIRKTVPYRVLKYESLLEFGFYSYEKNIKHLNLQKCSLREIPFCISKFEKLSHLNLSDNLLTTIENLDSLTSLEELKLGSSYKGYGNYISKIQGLNNLKKLKRLDLDNNHIERIENLNELENLETLVLDNNYIQEIKGIKNLKNLRKLYLKGNFIYDLRYIISPINLEFIGLEDNPVPLELDYELGYGPYHRLDKIKEYYKSNW